MRVSSIRYTEKACTNIGQLVPAKVMPTLNAFFKTICDICCWAPNCNRKEKLLAGLGLEPRTSCKLQVLYQLSYPAYKI